MGSAGQPRPGPRSTACSVINHDGKHRRQTFFFTDRLGLAQILPEQGRAGQYVHCHPRVFPALKFKEQQHIGPGILSADTSNHITGKSPNSTDMF